MMEIKRYILFKDGMIYEYIKQSDLYHYMKDHTVNVHGSKIRQELIAKTSDNILDLVEVGDLINRKTAFNTVSVDLVTKIVEDGFNVFYQGNYVVLYEWILAIYKLQSNGDYKKYEVKAE